MSEDILDTMQQHIEELTEERDSLSSKLEKCEAERVLLETANNEQRCDQ